MSDTRNHTTRDQLADVIREAVIDWNTLGTGKVGADVSTHITDALLASDAIAAVRAAAVAETTAQLDKERKYVRQLEVACDLWKTERDEAERHWKEWQEVAEKIAADAEAKIVALRADLSTALGHNLDGRSQGGADTGADQ